MTARTATSRVITKALETILTDADLFVGVGEVPEGGGWTAGAGESQFQPYATLYPLPGATDGPLDGSSEDGISSYQVTAVGSTVEQAEWVADAARVALCGARPVAGSRTVTLITCPVMAGVLPDDTVQPRVFFSADRFEVMSTPTSPG